MNVFAVPAEPPEHIRQMWDNAGGQWCRLDDGGGWVPADTPADEVHITENATHWQELVYEYGPVSATPPAEPMTHDDYVKLRQELRAGGLSAAKANEVAWRQLQEAQTAQERAWHDEQERQGR